MSKEFLHLRKKCQSGTVRGWLCGVLVALATSAPSMANTGTAAHDLDKVQRVVDRLRATLEIADEVQVAVVESNPTIASVGRAPGRPGFLLSIERGFLQALSTEELDALVAHELGHVWIFTHHPFLQTEQLANRVAMRLVSLDDLRRVYSKVWTAGALSGDLEVFLGVARARAED